MPHAPGQEPGFLRRNMVLARRLRAPATSTTSGSRRRSASPRTTSPGTTPTPSARFSESIYDSAEVGEDPGRRQGAPGRGRGHHWQGDRLQRIAPDGATRPRTRSPPSARTPPKEINQTLCRKEQQMLYLALRHAQHAVDLITEDDIARRRAQELRGRLLRRRVDRQPRHPEARRLGEGRRRPLLLRRLRPSEPVSASPSPRC